MSQPFPSLTIFRLNDTIDGSAVTRFDDFIDATKKWTSHPLQGSHPFEGQLFIAPLSEPKQPAWVKALEPGFGELAVPKGVNTSAVLIIRIKRGKRESYFAFTFGFGRFLLRNESYNRNYGLRVALNVIYPKRSEGEETNPNRLRSVDSRTVGANTFRTRRQVDRQTDFESFEIDIDRDLLGALTGTPSDIQLWGRRIDGSDALHLNRPVVFNKLGDVCLTVDKKSQKIPPQFSWVDKIFAVRKSDVVEKLQHHVLEMIRSENTGNLDLAPPDLLDWEQIDTFQFSFASGQQFVEPGIADYIAALRRTNKLDSLAIPQLTSGHRLTAFDPDGETLGHWTVFRSLSGEIDYHGKTYVLSEGEFFEVAKDYLAKLNAIVDGIKKFNGPLPPYGPKPAGNGKYGEGEYNIEAAQKANYLLLDKQLVNLKSRTTPIEICDILTANRELIHVKRKLLSSPLSHLFSQGLVSADLLLTSDEFRKAAREKILESENEHGRGHRFSKLFPPHQGITASDFSVVYAIIADWVR